jgi:hypothetical protein
LFEARFCEELVQHVDRDPDASIEFSPFESAKTTFRAPVIGTFPIWSALTWAREFIVYPGLDLNAPFPIRLADLSRSAFSGEMLLIAREAAGKDH